METVQICSWRIKVLLHRWAVQTHKPAHRHTYTYVHTVALALICNASNMWSYWPALWEAKLHGTHRNLHASLHTSVQSASCLAPVPVGQSNAPDEAHSPPPSPGNTHISTVFSHIHTHTPIQLWLLDIIQVACLVCSVRWCARASVWKRWSSIIKKKEQHHISDPCCPHTKQRRWTLKESNRHTGEN